MKNKRGLQISFSWLFAIIVGAFILFIAIYAATKIIGGGGDVTSAKTGKEIGILLNPLETSFESDVVTMMTIPSETRIHNRCDFSGIFGNQIIRISQKNFGKWSQTEIDIGFPNKYIFSELTVEGKDFFISSKPFDFPFKVADLVYLTSLRDSYCFIDAPLGIEKNILDLNQKNLYVENCPDESIKVCFSANYDDKCDIGVNLDSGRVIKNNKELFFETDALMYAAIYSESDIYECQVKRLIQRTRELLNIYEDKSKHLKKEVCDPEISFSSFKGSLNEFENSEDLLEISIKANDISRENKNSQCPLW